MIGKILPTEATHRSSDLFEKPVLLLNFVDGFCQLEFEVAPDRTKYFVLHIKRKIVQAAEANLKDDAWTATVVMKQERLQFLRKLFTFVLFSFLTVQFLPLD